MVQVRRWSRADGTFDWSPAAVERRARARSNLAYEAESSQAALDVLRELFSAVAGGSAELDARKGTTPNELRELTRLVDLEIARERLELEFTPFADSLRERTFREPELPPLKPLPPPAPDDSFIAVRLLDQRGNGVVGRAWTIELPDGTQHEGVTDPDGWARVAGFKDDGNAKVCFPDFDEVDMQTRSGATREIIPVEGGDESGRFLELTFVKPSGDPIPRAKFSITCDDGTVFQTVTDKDGFAKIIGLTSASAVVRLIKNSASAA